ncbi:MAG: tRNA threonylcarbamoyladenosine dehydratase [Proteobacteria bacterium]|nr:tRNA threonylcarbamoyladenosine dehydratase [Pseudomonadota bacterium]
MQKSYSSSTDQLARFSRIVDFLGEEGFAALRRANVVVMGLGGVGSHAALALVRGGVGRLKLIDFDEVNASDLNRHAVATPEDVNKSKASVMKRRLIEISCDTEVETVEGFFHVDTADELLAGPPDYVIDAIDGLNTKVALLRACVERGLPVVSSMGASTRSDPSLLKVGPIETSSGCPLAKIVRKRLRRQGVHSGITAVYSIEPPVATLPPDEDDVPFRGGRIRRRLPSLSALPGIFGYAAANVVITNIAMYGSKK